MQIQTIVSIQKSTIRPFQDDKKFLKREKYTQATY